MGTAWSQRSDGAPEANNGGIGMVTAWIGTVTKHHHYCRYCRYCRYYPCCRYCRQSHSYRYCRHCRHCRYLDIDEFGHRLARRLESLGVGTVGVQLARPPTVRLLACNDLVELRSACPGVRGSARHQIRIDDAQEGRLMSTEVQNACQRWPRSQIRRLRQVKALKLVRHA